VKNPVFLGVMVIVAAMPVGSNVSMINREYGEEKDSAAIAKCTVLSTVVSAIAIPVWAAVLLT
jgi:predicted permease